MAKVLFISERQIKDNSIIEENVESKLVRITIKEVQQLELLPIIGQKLYKEIEDAKLDKKNDSNFQYSDEIQTLLDNYINDFLIYGVLLSIPNALNYKYSNKGTVNITDANATNVIGSEIENVKRYYRAKYDAYRLRLVEYVNANCGGTKSPAQYSTGWYLKNEPDAQKIREANHYKTGWRL